MGAVVAVATLTNTTEPLGSWLTELMDPFGRESGANSGVTHLPVLLAETVDQFMLEENGVYVDGTTGDGGHSRAILQALPRVKTVLGIDWDSRSM